MNRNTFWSTTALLAIGLGAALSAHAQDPIMATTTPVMGQVAQSGQLLFTFKTSDADWSAQQRADMVYDRLRYVLGDSTLRANDIRIVHLNGVLAIYAKNHLISQVSVAEAAANQTTPAKLAAEWISNLKRVLPDVKARPDDPVHISAPIAQARPARRSTATAHR